MGQGAARGEAQPLGHVWPSLHEAALPGPARGGAIALLQTPQGHRPVDGLEDDGSALLGDGQAIAHIAAHQAGDGVEALHLKLVLHAAVHLAEPKDRPVDLEVLSKVLPLTGQNKVSGAGQRVSNQEVTISLHEVFCHLGDKMVREERERQADTPFKSCIPPPLLGQQKTTPFCLCFLSWLLACSNV